MPEEQNRKKIESDDFGIDNQVKTEKAVEAQTDLVPEESAPTKKKKFKAVRTYRDYAAEQLKSGGGSLTEMILAEREKDREKQRNSVKNKKNIFIIVLSVLSVAAGVAAIVAAFYFLSLTQERNQRINEVIIPPQPLVFSDFRKEVYVGSPTRNTLIRDVTESVEETSIPVGLVRRLVMSTDDELRANKILMPAETFLRGMEVDIAPRFYRTLGEEFFLGVYSSTNNSLFAIFTVDSYNAAYADMLEWERFMGSDLASLFGLTSQDFARASFGDIVLFNKDVRAVLDDSGEVLFGYSFIDQNTLVIFENRLALREIVTRAQNNKVRE